MVQTIICSNTYLGMSLDYMQQLIINIKFGLPAFLLLLPFLFINVCEAQLRESEPLPIFPKKITNKLQTGLTGWCYTLDGQWVTGDMKIPERFVSTDVESYNLEENRAGNDNIKELQLIPMLYGEDTLVMLVKFFRDGFYEFEARKKGWTEELAAYFYVFKQSELERLKNTINDKVQLIDISLMDYGKIRNADRFGIIEQVRPVLVVNSDTRRKLQFTIQKNYPENKIRFQFASIFPHSSDVEGVRRDFQLNGKSLYSNILLLDYMYYECKAKVLEHFLDIDTDQKFRYN